MVLATIQKAHLGTAISGRFLAPVCLILSVPLKYLCLQIYVLQTTKTYSGLRIFRIVKKPLRGFSVTS